MSGGGTLVAGCGNVFLGDDGFGVEVARRLAAEALPAGVRVADFGIRGVHLAYQLLEGYDTVILVDAMSRRAAPGTLFVLEPEVESPPGTPGLDGHGLDPAAVLRMVKLLGGSIGRVLVVGCEPETLEEQLGLSPPVARAVDDAVRIVLDLVTPRPLTQEA